MNDLLFDLIKKHRYDFDSTTLLYFKKDIPDLTYEWIKKKSTGKP